MATGTLSPTKAAAVFCSTENLPYEDWLEARKQGIGGSDASVVCGISRYKSPVELWMEKTGQLPAQEAGEAAYWGNLLESLVREEFTKRTGIAVTKPAAIFQSVEHPWMLANVDGLCEDETHGLCVFEAKTASAFKAGEWENGIPDEYLLQVQHYLAVLGCQGAYVAALIGGNRFRWTFVERDEELISLLISLEENFWKHVEKGVPPALDGSDASAKFLAERFPDSVPKSEMTLPDKAAELLDQYDLSCQVLKLATEQKQEAENQLKQMLENHESGKLGERLVTWKTVSQERLDTKTLKAEHPTLYKQYATRTSCRRFAVKSL